MALSCVEGFAYQDNALMVERVPLDVLARTYGTPLFVYSQSAIIQKIKAVKQALNFIPHLVTYAVKANDNLAILSLMAEQGLGADIVSIGELHRCKRAGIEQVVFSGVGKKRSELNEAIALGVRSINVESDAELEVILELIANRSPHDKPLGVCIRVNPEVDPVTHPYITTGLKTSKFGVTPAVAKGMMHRLVGKPGIRLCGLTAHIGSLMMSPEPLAESVQRLIELAGFGRSLGHPIDTIDAGGGWGVDYGQSDAEGKALTWAPTSQAFGEAIRKGFQAAGALNQGYTLLVELGRHLIANAAVLVSEVIYTKQQESKNFLIIDAAITELLRPSLYQAYHHILPVHIDPTRQNITVDVVGPVCESGDFLAKNRVLPEMRAGDLIALCSAGAYASVMSSQYNARPRAAHVWVKESTSACIRKRETVEDLWRAEVF